MLNLQDDNQEISMIYRDQYTPPAFWIDAVHLSFDLDPQKTRVLNKMILRRNPAVEAKPLRLNGEELNLARVLVNGQGTSFKLEADLLILNNLPGGSDPFELEIFTTCAPNKNTKLMGLYVSQDSFFTQCEPEGFRRITYFLDRPDVMAKYTITLRANKEQFPVLLSNGNLMDSGDLEDGRHFAVWQDPFKKPSYLFALVAGKFVAREQKIISRSGKEHLLQVYVRPNDLDKTECAMQSLISSVAWDEARFNLSLDLDRFMIVATSDFNMGAMENKGLNIFNSKYVLANPNVATDTDFHNIEAVVGHEYFHNWTGNRITCRDWFQLSLKEGLTVFRDQEFSKDMCHAESGRAVIRIDEVQTLRTAQFSEDAGPMAHPVRPDRYSAINNFYTATVYEKGAEVIRMMNTLVGREGFANGMKLYFERFDGQAVTCDDFAKTIADANPQSALAQHLETFKHWYTQAGTPVVHVADVYDEATQTYTLNFTQSCPDTPGQTQKKPFVIPIKTGLLDAETGEKVNNQHDLIVLTETTKSVVFEGVSKCPIPSLLRGFSAPIKIEYDYSQEQLLTLLKSDEDAFCRWEAGQVLALRIITAMMSDETFTVPAAYFEALKSVLLKSSLDAGYKSTIFSIPSSSYIADQFKEADPQSIHAARQSLRRQIAEQLAENWLGVYETHKDNEGYSPDHHSSGRRSLAAIALSNLCLLASFNGDPVWPGKALQQFKVANNMTDRMAALSALVNNNLSLANNALDSMYERFSHEDLVIDKWFAIQAAQIDCNGHVLPLVRTLTQHPSFNMKNPNRLRSLVSTYCNNHAAFHRKDAQGYVFWSEWVRKLDLINPQVAARLARLLERWNHLASPYRELALAQIQAISKTSTLSVDTKEIIDRALSLQSANE